MKLLLDTCTFLWIIKNAPELSISAKAAFSDPANEVYLSTVSIWELLVKHRLGRLPLLDAPEQFIVMQRKLHRIEPLSLQEDAVSQLLRLPEYHKDPFDRMLICQAITHGFTLLTPDKNIRNIPLQPIGSF